MIDLTPIINAVIALAAALIAYYVIPWLRRHTTEKEREELRWVNIAVKAAEQVQKQTDGPGRKSYVQSFLQSKGFDINDAAVDAAIEAAVLEMNQVIKGQK